MIMCSMRRPIIVARQFTFKNSLLQTLTTRLKSATCSALWTSHCILLFPQSSAFCSHANFSRSLNLIISRSMKTTSVVCDTDSTSSKSGSNTFESEMNYRQISESTGTKFGSILRNIPYFNKLAIRSECKVAAVRLYICCAEYSDFKRFSEKLTLDDTFVSWCQLLQLHMWMLMLRLKNHNLPLHENFQYLRTELNKSMWDDLDKRAKKLVVGSKKKESMAILGENYEATILNYDEGYFTNDQTLASAVWRCLLGKRIDVEPEDLLIVVDYIHRNLSHLENIRDEQLLYGYVTFLPLNSDKPNTEKDKSVYKIISDIS